MLNPSQMARKNKQTNLLSKKTGLLFTIKWALDRYFKSFIALITVKPSHLTQVSNSPVWDQNREWRCRKCGVFHENEFCLQLVLPPRWKITLTDKQARTNNQLNPGRERKRERKRKAGEREGKGERETFARALTAKKGSARHSTLIQNWIFGLWGIILVLCITYFGLECFPNAYQSIICIFLLHELT